MSSGSGDRRGRGGGQRAPRPPVLAQRLLQGRLPKGVQPFLLGDLEERFLALARRSPLRARIWYWRQTLAALSTRLPGVVGVVQGASAEGLVRDVRGALRSFRRHPVQAGAAVVTLGLGIGVVGTAFSILWGTVLQGLPFEEAERLVHFERSNRSRNQSSLAVTPHDYLAWREAQRSFEDLGAYVEAEAVLPRPDGPPERFVGVRISAGSFPLLRVTPVHGRAFAPADEVVGAPPVVLLSHRLWTARFGADPDLVGAEIPLNGEPTTVVGVMPEGFGFPIAEQLWLPLRIDLSAVARGSGRLDVFGRLRDGVELASAREEFGRIAAGLAAAFPETNAGVAAELRSFHDEYVGPEFTQTVVRLFAGALLVLLICCANVANLLLVRGSERARSLAVRVSLGATRTDVARYLLTEALAMAAVGALLGTLVAAYGVGWFNRAGTQAGVFALPHGTDSLFWWEVGLNGPTLAGLVGVTALTALLAGIAPAVRGSRVVTGLPGARGTAAATTGGRFAGGLVVFQLALTAGLLVAAGFVARSSANVSQAWSRVDGSGVAVAQFGLPTAQSPGSPVAYPDHEGQRGFTERLLERLEAEPDIGSAAFATYVPLQRPRSSRFSVQGAPPSLETGPETGVISVSPGYFRSFGVRVVRGRSFDERDGPASLPVAVVNESFARLHLDGGPALGAQVRLGDPDPEADVATGPGSAEAPEPWLTVVGVVPDLWESPSDPSRVAGLYVPLGQSSLGDPTLRLGPWGLRYPTVLARSRTGREPPAQTIRASLYELDRSLPLRRLRAMDEVVRERMGRYAVWGRFYLAFAVVGLLLAAIGVYGVLSFWVTSRTPDIGVRRALGATAASVRRDVLRRAGLRVAAGIGIGLVLGAVFARGLTQILYGVETRDPIVFAGVALVMILVSGFASWVPALRAARVDPLEAIRSG